MYLSLAAIALLVGAALVYSSGGGSVKKPAPPPLPAAIEADLTTNFGVIPMDVRKAAMLAEKGAGIPGLGRALAVYWWSVWRGQEPAILPAMPGDPVRPEVVELAAKAPTLCFDCFAGDPRATAELTKLVKAGYSVPAAAEWYVQAWLGAV